MANLFIYHISLIVKRTLHLPSTRIILLSRSSCFVASSAAALLLVAVCIHRSTLPAQKIFIVADFLWCALQDFLIQNLCNSMKLFRSFFCRCLTAGSDLHTPLHFACTENIYNCGFSLMRFARFLIQNLPNVKVILWNCLVASSAASSGSGLHTPLQFAWTKNTKMRIFFHMLWQI